MTPRPPAPAGTSDNEEEEVSSVATARSHTWWRAHVHTASSAGCSLPSPPPSPSSVYNADRHAPPSAASPMHATTASVHCDAVHWLCANDSRAGGGRHRRQASVYTPSRGGAGLSSRGVVLGVQSFKPSMKCGLIVYSATILVVTLCVLSFYVPAVIYQLRNGRRGAVALPPRGAGGRYGLAPAGGAASAGAGSSFQPLLAGSSVMVVTANQPLPCTTRRGDWVMGLALRNKLMYATLHGYKMWWSTELVSSWDLEAAWNKVPLLYILMHPESTLSQGIEWMLWMDDDAVFTDMEFVFPFADYDAAGVNLVIWGDPQRVYRANDIQGLNTGVFLLRKCEWSRQLMAEVAALATPSIRRQIGNKGRIAEQGALTWCSTRSLPSGRTAPSSSATSR